MEKISQEQAIAAIKACENAIDSDGDLSWVRESAKLERVYFAGLFVGLSEIAEFDHIKNTVLQKITSTLFERAGDLSFLDAFIENNLSEISATLQEIEWQTKCLAATEKFETAMEDMGDQLSFCLNSAKDILVKIKVLSSPAQCSNQPMRDAHGAVQHLIMNLRQELDFLKTLTARKSH
jgi:hypothetical protein